MTLLRAWRAWRKAVSDAKRNSLIQLDGMGWVYVFHK